MSKKDTNSLHLIMTAASRIETLVNHYIFNPAGLTFSSFQILRILNSEGAKSPTELVEIIGSSKSNITQRLQHLEKKKLIKRVSQDEDKRRLIIDLSEEGKRKIKSILEQMDQAEQHMEKFFTAAEAKAHKEFFIKLNNLLNICESNSFKNYEELL